MGKDKPKDKQEYIKDKKRKYGENWKDYISSGDPGKWKEKQNQSQTWDQAWEDLTEVEKSNGW